MKVLTSRLLSSVRGLHYAPLWSQKLAVLATPAKTPEFIAVGPVQA